MSRSLFYNEEKISEYFTKYLRDELNIDDVVVKYGDEGSEQIWEIRICILPQDKNQVEGKLKQLINKGLAKADESFIFSKKQYEDGRERAKFVLNEPLLIKIYTEQFKNTDKIPEIDLGYNPEYISFLYEKLKESDGIIGYEFFNDKNKKDLKEIISYLVAVEQNRDLRSFVLQFLSPDTISKIKTLVLFTMSLNKKRKLDDSQNFTRESKKPKKENVTINHNKILQIYNEFNKLNLNGIFPENISLIMLKKYFDYQDFSYISIIQEKDNLKISVDVTEADHVKTKLKYLSILRDNQINYNFDENVCNFDFAIDKLKFYLEYLYLFSEEIKLTSENITAYLGIILLEELDEKFEGIKKHVLELFTPFNHNFVQFYNKFCKVNDSEKSDFNKVYKLVSLLTKEYLYFLCEIFAKTIDQINHSKIKQNICHRVPIEESESYRGIYHSLLCLNFIQNFYTDSTEREKAKNLVLANLGSNSEKQICLSMCEKGQTKANLGIFAIIANKDTIRSFVSIINNLLLYNDQYMKQVKPSLQSLDNNLQSKTNQEERVK